MTATVNALNLLPLSEHRATALFADSPRLRLTHLGNSTAGRHGKDSNIKID